MEQVVECLWNYDFETSSSNNTEEECIEIVSAVLYEPRIIDISVAKVKIMLMRRINIPVFLTTIATAMQILIPQPERLEEHQ